jgi:ATP-binding cassette, subfamily B, bacterial
VSGAATPERGWLRRLAGHCWRYRRNLLLSFGAALLGMGVTALVPLVQRQIIDQVILAHRQPLAPWAALLVLGAGVTFGMTFVRRYFGGRLSVDVQYDLRTGIFEALSRLDGARQDDLDTGQVVGRASSDLTMIQGLLMMLPNMVGSFLLFVLALAVMLVLSPTLTLVALAVVPALWLLANSSRRRLFPSSWFAQQTAAEVAGAVENATTGVRVVKGFGQEDRELRRLEGIGQRLFGARVRTIRFNSVYTPAMQAVPALGQVGVLALGGWLAVHGQITLGTFLAFSTYLAQMSAPVRMLAMLLTLGQQAKASVVRVFELMDSRPLVTEKPDAAPLPRASAAIDLDDVHFGYVPSRPVLEGLTLRVEPGETVALVGAPGSGKSTVSLLLPRFYDVQEGAVRVGGRDVRDLTLESLRSAIGLVMEDTFLFSESVRSNIAYGRPRATDEEVEAAARAAEADGFIGELPDGYRTVVGEQGLTLSGGQRQRVALARALLTDPAILVLDDATSAVDARVEAEIHATLRKVFRGRTTLLIAHRRSTLELADRIAVIDGGRLVDVGTEEELLERSPLFRLLLSGPGADAEGVDAGDLDAQAGRAGDPGQEGQVGGITPSLWDPSRSPSPPPSQAQAALRMQGAGYGGPMGGMGSLPPSPELLAQVAALPPADDRPRVDPAFARANLRRFSLWTLLTRFRAPLLLGLLLVAVDAVAMLALPILVRNGINNGVTQHQTAAVFAAAFVGLVVVLADWLIQVGEIRVTGRTGERFLYTLRVKTFAHLQRLGLDYYEREMAGRIMTRMTTDIDALSTFLQTGLVTAVVSLLSFAGILVALVLLDPRLAFVVFAVLPPLAVATLIFRQKASAAYREARERVSTVNADLQENVAGMRVAQAFRREEHNRERFAGLSDDYRVARVRSQRYISVYFPFVQFLSDLAAALVLVFGAIQYGHGGLTAGALIAYLLYIGLLFSPVQQLSQVFDGYQQAAVGLRRIRELLGTPTSTPLPRRPRPVRRLSGRIDLEDVHFAYAGATEDAIAGVDLHVPAGQTVALVGETGAGKSTLVKLVARFYDVTSGAVRIDGTDVRELDLAAYRHRLGIVPQEAYLFPGTVRDAIAYGRPQATDAEVEAAARAVGAHETIARLAGGYLHPIAERGRNLSAGQRQLIALARAQLVDPDILLLDEATASLDLATEAAVVRATDRLARRRTTLVVAHRLTTAARADRVVVLDHGRIVESGTHDELLRAAGRYAAMWRTLMGEPALAG